MTDKNNEFDFEDFFENGKQSDLFQKITDEFNQANEDSVGDQSDNDWGMLANQVVGHENFGR